MRRVWVVVAVGLALTGVLSAAPAQAQNQHSFVSSQGNDANACTLAAPCRHLQAALAATISGGEIAILDTAGYNGGTTVTINQAVSIVNPGGFEAAIAPPSGGSGVGIEINAGANDAVSLRGLSIDGAGVGSNGIQFSNGASLTVENCVIRHMANDGILFVSSTATSSLTVSNTLIADNGSDGIVVQPIGSATAVFNRVEVNNHHGGEGIFLYGGSSAGTNTINATVSESVAAGNEAGFFIQTDSSHAPISLMIFHSVVANNTGPGVVAQGSGATIRLANSTVTGNGIGWDVISSSVVGSYGDNYIDGNGTNTGSLTPISKQ